MRSSSIDSKTASASPSAELSTSIFCLDAFAPMQGPITTSVTMHPVCPFSPYRCSMKDASAYTCIYIHGCGRQLDLLFDRAVQVSEKMVEITYILLGW